METIGNCHILHQTRTYLTSGLKAEPFRPLHVVKEFRAGCSGRFRV